MKAFRCLICTCASKIVCQPLFLCFIHLLVDKIRWDGGESYLISSAPDCSVCSLLCLRTQQIERWKNQLQLHFYIYIYLFALTLCKGPLLYYVDVKIRHPNTQYTHPSCVLVLLIVVYCVYRASSWANLWQNLPAHNCASAYGAYDAKFISLLETCFARCALSRTNRVTHTHTYTSFLLSV